MPTVRKQSPGRVTIHGIGTFEQGDTAEVDGDTAEYLTEDRGDFEEVIDVEAPEAETTPEEPETVEEHIDAGECPWCDDYSGDHVGRHASSAHPEEWEAYQGGD